MEDIREKDYEVMRTYARAWKTDIVMYHLFGIPLWFPFSLRQAGFFVVGLLITFMLAKVIPGIKKIPILGDPVLIYGGYPFLIMKFFTQLTLDGKPPHVYFKDQILFLMQEKRYSMYKPIAKEEKVKYSSGPAYRIIKKISSIDYNMMKKGGR